MYLVKAHSVTAERIVGLQPLVVNGVMAAPDAGFTLVLADDSKRRWVADKIGAVPSVEDFLVTDPELNVTYVISAAKFSEMFVED